jgi:hypothetical protein
MAEIPSGDATTNIQDLRAFIENDRATSKADKVKPYFSSC